MFKTIQKSKDKDGKVVWEAFRNTPFAVPLIRTTDYKEFKAFCESEGVILPARKDIDGMKCHGHYYIRGGWQKVLCEGEVPEPDGKPEIKLKQFTVSLAVDGRVDVNIFSTDLDAAMKEARNITSIDTEYMEVIGWHPVNISDAEGNLLKDF